MRGNILKTCWVVMALLLSTLATQALAGGPLLLADPATKTPYAYASPVPVLTDLGTLGAVTNATADGRVASSAAAWSGVATSSFSAGITGDFSLAGLPDITGANAALVIGADNSIDGIYVIYDTDGTITQNFLGAPPGVLGIASPEFAAGSTITESWVVLNGATVNAGDLPGAATWHGVITHEMGHSINLAHTQTNGAILFFGDATGPSGCAPPYGGGPGLAHTETMYPFIDVTPGSTGLYQATVTHLDDRSTLSDIYPAAGYPASHGIINGTIYGTDGVSELTGVNVIARNIANPFTDANSALSGDYTQGDVGPDGTFRLTGLTPGASYVVYVDEIVNGGYSTTPIVLGAAEEFWNLSETNLTVTDPPCDFSAIVVAAGQTVTADIKLNSSAPPSPIISVTPGGGFSFSIPTNTTDADVMNIANIGPAGASDLNWSLADATSAIGLPVNDAEPLDPSRVRIENGKAMSLVDARDPAAARQCTDCGNPHPVKTTKIDFSTPSAAMVGDGSFELGPGGGTWTEASSNFGTPICDTGACGTGAGTGPRTGTYWCWFGGFPSGLEIGSVSQSVVFPSTGSLSLEFFSELPVCDSPSDFMEVLVDGTPVYFVDGSSAACGVIGYSFISVDVSAWADGGSHLLEFRSETYASGGGATNFFVDDIALVEALADCPWLSAAPTNGTVPQGGSTPVSVMVDATGLAPGIYTCELQIASNDPSNPLVIIPVDLEVTDPAIYAEVEYLFGPPLPLSLLSVPDGSGDPLSAAQFGSPPATVDATILVRLLDGGGSPVVGFPPELISVQAAAGGWLQCPGNAITADAPTNAAGETTISGPLHAGGFSSPGELMEVTVNDPLLAGMSYPGGLPGLEIFVNSPDADNNFTVNLADIPLFAAIFYGPYDYAADFVWNGIVDVADIPPLAAAIDATCPPLPPEAGGSSAEVEIAASESIGMTFGSPVGASGRPLEPGQQVDAYLVVDGPAVKDGISAFDARIRTTDNVVIHEMNVMGDGINLGSGRDFTVGLASAARAAASQAAPLVHLRVSVTDAEPAHFWVEPTVRSDEDLPMVATDGKLRSARPTSGDVSSPVAALNDVEFALEGGNVPSPQLSLGVAPNPFNPMTNIKFNLPARGMVELHVYDMRGQLVATLHNEVMEAGRHETVWNGTDQTGRTVASGVYFSKLKTDSGTLLEKMMLMK